jgi:hypothetical protein
VQYVELVKGTFYGVPPDATALVVWLAAERAAEDYTYDARQLRGRQVDAQTYTVDRTELDEEWLRVEDGVLSEYGSERYRSAARSEVSARMKLKLHPVPRDRQLAQRLQYPEPIAND